MYVEDHPHLCIHINIKPYFIEKCTYMYMYMMHVHLCPHILMPWRSTQKAMFSLTSVWGIHLIFIPYSRGCTRHSSNTLITVLMWLEPQGLYFSTFIPRGANIKERLLFKGGLHLFIPPIILHTNTLLWQLVFKRGGFIFHLHDRGTNFYLKGACIQEGALNKWV